MKDNKVPYICAPLTELPVEEIELAKDFYESLAGTCEKAIGKRAFVPHERYDPKAHANFSPPEVDRGERKQVCEKTSILIIVAIFPSWGGGIEVEMANSSGVPSLILCEEGKKLSRLLLGNPSVKTVIYYKGPEDALKKLAAYLKIEDMDIVSACSEKKKDV